LRTAQRAWPTRMSFNSPLSTLTRSLRRKSLHFTGPHRLGRKMGAKPGLF
jgi:hypothetical protein